VTASPDNDAPSPLPNLLCVGVEKCGTTWLHTLFSHSPQILTPRKKELFFFNKNYDEGLDWYRQWFDYTSKPGSCYVCDITPSYFRSDDCLQRVVDALGEPKIIVVLRHPVYRALSHYVHRVRHMAVQLQSYPTSLFEEFYIGQHRDLLFPHYHWHLNRLLRYFPREQIVLLNYDVDLQSPALLQTKLEEFLQIDLEIPATRLKTKVNDGLMPRFYHRELTGEELTIDDCRYTLPPDTLLLAHSRGTRVWPNIDPDVARQNIDASTNWTGGLGTKVIRTLFNKRFAGDCRKVADIWGLDTAIWRQTADPIAYRAALPDVDKLQQS
jgi:hypothetical protein